MTSPENKRTIAALNSLITNIITGKITSVGIRTKDTTKATIISFSFKGSPELYTQEGDTYG